MQRLEIAEICHAVGSGCSLPGSIGCVVTDSRLAKPDSLFVAIRGEHFDGHDFAASALDKGAVCVVTERPILGIDAAHTIIVKDTKRAYIAIGGLHRAKFSIPVVGVTGSVGKTTTKEFVYAVLSSSFKTHKNEGNQNNELGVPATLLDLDAAHQAAVIEMGMSAPGEIKDLAMATRPCVGIITAIGVSHIEMLGSRENILKAKAEIIEGMPREAPLLVCSDDDMLSMFFDDRVRVMRYATNDPKADIKAENITVCSAEKTKFSICSPWGNFDASIPVLGEHNVRNALAAFAAGCLLDVLPSKAARALSEYVPAGMRQKTVQYNDMTVVEDCYNASPDSLRAAAKTLGNYPAKGRKILVVSDMLELGEKAAEMHEACGTFAAASGIDRLMATGPLSKHTIHGAKSAGFGQAEHYSDKKALASALLSQAQPNDILWFKASRGMQLEEVIEEFYRGGAAH